MSVIAFSSFYLECDAPGCDESFLVHDTDASARDVRRAAEGHGWTVEEDEDFCSMHERDNEVIDAKETR